MRREWPGAVHTAVRVYTLPRVRGAVCTRRSTPQPRPGPGAPQPCQADSLGSGDWGVCVREKAGLAGCRLAALPDRFLHFGAARVLPGLLWVFCVDSPVPEVAEPWVPGTAVGCGRQSHLGSDDSGGADGSGRPAAPDAGGVAPGAAGVSSGASSVGLPALAGPALSSVQATGGGCLVGFGQVLCPRQPWHFLR